MDGQLSTQIPVLDMHRLNLRDEHKESEASKKGEASKIGEASKKIEARREVEASRQIEASNKNKASKESELNRTNKRPQAHGQTLPLFKSGVAANDASHPAPTDRAPTDRAQAEASEQGPAKNLTKAHVKQGISQSSGQSTPDSPVQEQLFGMAPQTTAACVELTAAHFEDACVHPARVSCIITPSTKARENAAHGMLARASISAHALERPAATVAQKASESVSTVTAQPGISALSANLDDQHMYTAWQLSNALKAVKRGRKVGGRRTNLSAGQRHKVGNAICEHLLASLRQQVRAEQQQPPH